MSLGRVIVAWSQQLAKRVEKGKSQERVTLKLTSVVFLSERDLKGEE